jgi:hypothetical protein
MGVYSHTLSHTQVRASPLIGNQTPTINSLPTNPQILTGTFGKIRTPQTNQMS